jgi:hypothetical protein
MTSLFFFLLSNPEYMRRVQDEIDAVYPPGEDALNTSKHGKLKFLNACMWAIPNSSIH